VSIRDLLAWVEFICLTTNDTKPEVESELLVSRSMKQLDLSAAYIHGACIVFVDALVTSGHCQYLRIKYALC